MLNVLPYKFWVRCLVILNRWDNVTNANKCLPEFGVGMAVLGHAKLGDEAGGGVFG